MTPLCPSTNAGALSLYNQAEQLLHLLGPDKGTFHWVQFKEKLGSAHFYSH